MHDPPGVRRREPLARLDDDLGRLVEREPPARAELLLQVAPGQVLHDEVRALVRQGAVVEDADDVLALNGHEGAGFALEPGEGVLAVDVLGLDQLDRDLLTDELVRS